MLKRLIVILLGAVFITLAFSSLALAATPEEIYNDYRDNGKLDQSYSCQDLKTAIDDATLNQYGDQDIMDAIRTIYEKQCRNEFPFTGYQLLITCIVAVVIIVAGFALRRFARTKSS
jgi:hypothetical protein